MPNHCQNHLTVSGPPADVTAFVKAATDAKSLVDAFVPMPTELEGTTAGTPADPDEVRERNIRLYGAPDWYDWANKNWGTKWGDYDTDLLGHTDDTAVFTYTTAWAPMDKAITSISKQFPTLTFEVTYEESGMCFMGVNVDRNGERVAEAFANEDEWPDLVELPDGDFDWDGYEEKLSVLRDRLVSEVVR